MLALTPKRLRVTLTAKANAIALDGIGVQPRVRINLATRHGVIVFNGNGTANPVRITLSTTRNSIVFDNANKSLRLALQQAFQGPKGLKGDQGDIGPAGPSGTGQVAPIAFSYGDASPAPIYTPSANCIADVVQAVIRVPFNGVGALIAVGTAADPELLMPYAYNAPGQVGTYEVSPDVVLLAGVAIILTIVPGAGAVAGSGHIMLNLANL